jgi:hypothetical protein
VLSLRIEHVASVWVDGISILRSRHVVLLLDVMSAAATFVGTEPIAASPFRTPDVQWKTHFGGLTQVV